jgi:F0F1-type ATP synthase assembly protein I
MTYTRDYPKPPDVERMEREADADDRGRMAVAAFAVIGIWGLIVGVVVGVLVDRLM